MCYRGRRAVRWTTRAAATSVAVLVAVILAETLLAVASPIAGPFRMVPEHLENCPDDMQPKRLYYTETHSAVRDRQNPSAWFYSFNVTTFITTNDNYTVDLNLASWSSRGGWIDNAFRKTLSRPCTGGRTVFPVEWRKAMKHFFDDPDRKCPFPPGTYTATNVSTKHDFGFPATFFYGKYRGTVQVANALTKDLVLCQRAYFAIVPRGP